MFEQDIRWKQRFSNFVKVFEHLKNALNINEKLTAKDEICSKECCNVKIKEN